MIYVVDYLDLSVLIVIIFIVTHALFLIIQIIPTDVYFALLLLGQVVKDVIGIMAAIIAHFLTLMTCQIIVYVQQTLIEYLLIIHVIHVINFMVLNV